MKRVPKSRPGMPKAPSPRSTDARLELITANFVGREERINWTRMLPASPTRIAPVNPAISTQHWDGKGADGKLNNAIQILKGAAQTGVTIEQNLANSDAAQNAHPEIAATAAKLLPSALQ